MDSVNVNKQYPKKIVKKLSFELYYFNLEARFIHKLFKIKLKTK